MATTTQLIAVTGVNVVTDHDFELEIEPLTGAQRQGDVILVPAVVTAKTAVPQHGTPVVQGENGGNTHAIYAADGPVYCDTQTPTVNNLRVACLSVPEGSIAYLGHPEHGFLAIAAGSYELRRQREMAEEMRMIAD
ncbi:hypothetical protein [Mycobacterium kansasii]|uniref:hypothetical protein n=1 Tax=Mycobacterium kansasii TaxID=1768 RepID=UPI000CDE316B|nr:hypothetical protein [Mycobacterium kansasii]POY10464.1 hypothetical protein C3472_27425 [Mycobacterium kansasii]